MQPYPSRIGLVAPVAVGLAALQLSSGLGCGPFFRENLLETPDYLRRSPEFHFMDQFRRRAGAFAAEGEREDRACTLDREMAEMEEIMASAIPDAAERAAWLDDYRGLRRGMLVVADRSMWRVTKENVKVPADLDPRIGRREWPDKLPSDVRLYLDGAASYVEHLASREAAPLETARTLWRSVLDLPVEERRHRGVWAAWMLFRTSPAKDLAEERRWLGLVRELQAAGAADSQHFAEEATAILGRMGAAPAEAPPSQHVSASEHLRALARRQALGHSRGEQELAAWAMSDFTFTEEEAAAIAADEELVRLVTMALVEQSQSVRARITPEFAKERLGWWFDFLEKNPPAHSGEFTLLAWSAYGLGEFENAGRGLALAPADDPAANWLRGKLAAMKGRLDESSRLLELAATDLSQAEEPTPGRFDPTDPLHDLPDRRRPTPAERSRGRMDQVRGDLALVQIAASDYEDALVSLLGTEHWYDAAYLAERLLSPEQVLTIARRTAPPLPGTASPEGGRSVEEIQRSCVGGIWEEQGRETILDRFRYLVARKSARQGWFKDARPFFPPEARDALDHYAEAVKRGGDRRLPNRERAAALWKAARMHRSLGMAFFGYEIGPDHAIYGGAFDLGDLAETRRIGFRHYSWENPEEFSEEERESRRLRFPAAPDELWSNRRYGPGGKPRFHYRYDAAELARRAAALLPRNDDLAARILCTAGTWLKARDAAAAEPFYKELVLKHGETELGREADVRRWFPEIDVDYNERFPPLR